ncbi:MAG: hypothetical protein IKM97_06115 [Clostridia bacterium]|nr:hypothetical protein [Clostridia bacterium]
MKTRIISILICFLILFMLLSFTNFVNADSPTMDDAITAMKGIKDYQQNGEDNVSIGKLGELINIVIGFIQIVGTAISLIMISVLGIKYMLAAPNEKADVKKQIAPLLIGAIILFSAVNLVQIVANFASTID